MFARIIQSQHQVGLFLQVDGEKNGKLYLYDVWCAIWGIRGGA
jgi:hypothetical protein